MHLEAEYLHGSSVGEQERLERQHRLVGGASFLPALRSGMKILEVGCGTGAVAREVAPKVVPAYVVGLDRDETQLATARRMAERGGLRNVAFVRGNAERLEFPDDEFDLVYGRFLLEHVSDPAVVVREMVRVTKPGGTLVACECVTDCCTATAPSLGAGKKALDALYRLQKLRGGDAAIGERLEQIFRDTGLEAVRGETLSFPITTAADVLDYASGAIQMLKAVEAGLLGAGLLSREDLARAYEDWERFGRAAGAKALFKLRRVEGAKPLAGAAVRMPHAP